MWFRFRKTIPIGKFFRVNLSKSGVGASVGIPGTGLSWGVSTGRGRRVVPGPSPMTPGRGGPLSLGIPGNPVVIACCRCKAKIRTTLPPPRKAFPCPSCGALLRVKPPAAGGHLRSLAIGLGCLVVAVLISLGMQPGGSRFTGAPSGFWSAPTSSTSRPAWVAPGYHVGPRGGVYRYSSGGRKVYDRKK